MPALGAARVWLHSARRGALQEPTHGKPLTRRHDDLGGGGDGADGGGGAGLTDAPRRRNTAAGAEGNARAGG
jgi:hypothetical protein